MTHVYTAYEIARRHLACALPRRWRHVQGVARQAQTVAEAVGQDTELLIAAAWLHDIGYSPALRELGFHPLDGARYLRKIGCASRLTRLVAHHSYALMEAKIRGLDEVLVAEFPREESATADALWTADLTAGPNGEHFTVTERLEEVQQRYGPGHVTSKFVDAARPDLIGAVSRTASLLRSRDRDLLA